MKKATLLLFTFCALISTSVCFGQSGETGEDSGKKGDSSTKGNSIRKLVIDASNGQTTLQNGDGKDVDINYVRKANRVEVEVKNVASNQSVTMIIKQDDIQIEGDNAINSINPDDYNVDGTEDQELEDLNKQITNFVPAEEEGINKETTKLDTLYLILIKEELKDLVVNNVERAVDLNSDELKKTLIASIESDIALYSSRLDEYKNLSGTAFYSEARALINKLKLLKDNVAKKTFVQYFYFTPEKESIDLEFNIHTKVGGATTKKTLYTDTYFTRRRVKLFGSVGVHGLVYGDKSSQMFANRDSLIVSGKGTQFTPSFGTYMNIAWRGNDYLGGFGFGTGIPINIDGSTDITPNFCAFGTLIFQGGNGRMGINLGVAVRRTNVLSPGYAVGDNLGNSSLDVPTIQVWKPALMFGFNYNIASKAN